MTVELYTDGACSGNPGPGGWCSILRYGKYEKRISGMRKTQKMANDNYARWNK